MELPADLEEILSDDYEEGEILDGDNLYEEVSSLEEFSSGDEESSQLNNSNLETDKLDSSGEKLKQSTKHRRKDHKCKENSVCRRERKGKHCYARIRKAKSALKYKTFAEAVPQSTVERVFPRKPDITPIIKHLKITKPTSPYKTRPNPPPKISHRYDYKDYHEKENRHSNKRFWTAPPIRSKMKQPEKYAHYNRSKANNHYSKSRYLPSTPPPRISSNDTSKTEPTKRDNSSSKTSLLKRLVGSGAAGVKPIKENEPPIVLPKSETLSHETIPAPDPVTVPPAETEDILKTTQENNEEADSTTTNGEVNTEDIQKSETQPEPPKKVEVKWIRSIKDDKDELHLRVEALRSAWVKKFHDRKKKGLIHQKKSDDVDDFLEDFAFSSDNEEKKNDEAIPLKSDEVSAENKCVPCFNATDISGDILKPEDMVIVNDRTNEEPIISETAVTTTEGNSSVFVDPLFFSGGHFPTNICQVSSSNGNINLTVNEPGLNAVTAKNAADVASEKNWKQMVHKNNTEKKEVTPVKKSNESCSQSSSQNSNRSKSKRTRWRKRRKSKGSVTEVGGKNVSNICADFDDDISYLRQLALLSVKSKNRNSIITREIEGNEKDPKGIEELSVQNKPVDNANNESESTGVRSSDNWEDDLDEDILRAKLLSSLTKQVSGNSANIEKEAGIEQEPLTNYKNMLLSSKMPKSTMNLMRPLSSKKQMMKKLDRRKLKNTNKKVWKQSNVCIKKTRLEANITINRFGKPSVFKKSEKTIPHNKHPSVMRPIPQVPQMIITVDDSDSSSDLDTSNPEIVKPSPAADPVPADIEANIDLLLREAAVNSQIDKGIVNTSAVSKPDDKEESVKLPISESIKNIAAAGALQTETKRFNIKTPTSTSSSSSCSSIPTPQALKHLPAWQQEEYKRLKKKIAEKEKVLQVTRSKIIEPVKDINANTPVSSEGKVLLIPEANLPVSNNCSISPVTVPSVLCTESSTLTSCTNNEKFTGSIDTANNATSSEHLTTSEVLQTNEVDVSNPSKVEKACSVEENNASKKSFPNLVSCSIMEEINVMNDVVNDFEKNNSEYMDLKQKMARLKRILKATESKMTVKKKRMFQIRDTITEKERQISSKIATFFMTSSSSEKNKPPSRDMELVKLKYKEVSLRAQFLFHDFLSEKVTTKDRDKKVTDNVFKPELKGKEILPTGVKRTSSSKETSPLKKKVTVKESIMVKSVLPMEKSKDHTEAPMKRNFSGKEREREEWDPNTPVCHYDLNGICRDEECQYQHFKTV